MGELTIDELASRTGEPVTQLRDWLLLGLFGTDPAERFELSDVDRVRVIQFLRDHRVDLAVVAEAVKDGRLDLSYGSYVGPYLGLPEGPWCSPARAAEVVGLPADLVVRLCHVMGVAEEGESVSAADLRMLEGSKAWLDAGFPEEALVQLWQVFADALGRVAEAEVRLFHFYVHERLRAAGVSRSALQQLSDATAERLIALVGPATVYFHRKGSARAVLDDLQLHLASESPANTDEPPGKLPAGVMFVDLSSFTPLTEAMGDVKAAEVLERFASLVRQAAALCKGRVVKQIGDAFMLVFFDAPSALRCALEIEGRTSREPSFPAVRSGVHWGPVLYREGDYVGTNVNIAARLAEAAGRHHILVTTALRSEAGGLPEVEFVPLGKRLLKGLVEEIEVFEARPRRAEAGKKAVDPVCGMELAPNEVAARLSLGGAERLFCSEACLRQFMAAPQRYPA